MAYFPTPTDVIAYKNEHLHKNRWLHQSGQMTCIYFTDLTPFSQVSLIMKNDVSTQFLYWRRYIYEIRNTCKKYICI